MQTKGLAGFYQNGALVLAYQENSALPEELGTILLEEVRHYSTPAKIKQLGNRIEQLISPHESTPLTSGSRLQTEIRRHFGTEMQNPHATDIYSLYEPFQGTLLPFMDGRLTGFPFASDFLRDSKFCEWAYVVNLDGERFDILKGHQTTQPEERVYQDELLDAEPISIGSQNYHPCARILSYRLSELPTRNQFLNDIDAFR